MSLATQLLCIDTYLLLLRFIIDFLGEIIKGLPYELDLEIPYVYVRKCYVEMLPLLCESMDELFGDGLVRYKHAIRVTGTPGIGKSYFLAYVWHQLLRMKCNVVASMNSVTIMSHQGGEGYGIITGQDLNQLVETRRDVIYLVDPAKNAVPQPIKHAITILFVSPAEECHGSFCRVSLINLYMPIWEKEELLDCIKKVYPQMKDHFDSRFKKWGGSIRCMSATSTIYEEYEEHLQDFLSDDSLIDILNQTNKNGFLRKHVTKYLWLVPLKVAEKDGVTNYRKISTATFPSEYVSIQVAEKIRSLGILGKDWKVVEDALLLGRVYEVHVMKYLFKVSGGSISAKQISSGPRDKAPEETLPAITAHEVFTNSSVISKPVSGTLYVPLEPNKDGMDFVMPPWVFQITIQKNHKAKNLENIFQQFPSTKKWNACFVVPSARLDEFVTPGLSLYPSIVKKFIIPFDFGSDITGLNE